MENKVRAKMPPSLRAKQFMPFSALRGLSEALRRKESVQVPPPELSDFGMEQLDRKLARLRPGMHLAVTFCQSDEQGQSGYRRVTGVLSSLEQATQSLTLAGQRIAFSSIRDIALFGRQFSLS